MKKRRRPIVKNNTADFSDDRYLKFIRIFIERGAWHLKPQSERRGLVRSFMTNSGIRTFLPAVITKTEMELGMLQGLMTNVVPLVKDHVSNRGCNVWSVLRSHHSHYGMGLRDVENMYPSLGKSRSIENAWADVRKAGYGQRMIILVGDVQVGSFCMTFDQPLPAKWRQTPGQNRKCFVWSIDLETGKGSLFAPNRERLDAGMWLGYDFFKVTSKVLNRPTPKSWSPKPNVDMRYKALKVLSAAEEAEYYGLEAADFTFDFNNLQRPQDYVVDIRPADFYADPFRHMAIDDSECPARTTQELSTQSAGARTSEPPNSSERSQHVELPTSKARAQSSEIPLPVERVKGKEAPITAERPTPSEPPQSSEGSKSTATPTICERAKTPAHSHNETRSTLSANPQEPGRSQKLCNTPKGRASHQECDTHPTDTNPKQRDVQPGDVSQIPCGTHQSRTSRSPSDTHNQRAPTSQYFESLIIPPGIPPVGPPNEIIFSDILPHKTTPQNFTSHPGATITIVIPAKPKAITATINEIPKSAEPPPAGDLLTKCGVTGIPVKSKPDSYFDPDSNTLWIRNEAFAPRDSSEIEVHATPVGWTPTPVIWEDDVIGPDKLDHLFDEDGILDVEAAARSIRALEAAIPLPPQMGIPLTAIPRVRVERPFEGSRIAPDYTEVLSDDPGPDTMPIDIDSVTPEAFRRYSDATFEIFLTPEQIAEVGVVNIGSDNEPFRQEADGLHVRAGWTQIDIDVPGHPITFGELSRIAEEHQVRAYLPLRKLIPRLFRLRDAAHQDGATLRDRVRYELALRRELFGRMNTPSLGANDRRHIDYWWARSFTALGIRLLVQNHRETEYKHRKKLVRMMQAGDLTIEDLEDTLLHIQQPEFTLEYLVERQRVTDGEQERQEKGWTLVKESLPRRRQSGRLEVIWQMEEITDNPAGQNPDEVVTARLGELCGFYDQLVSDMALIRPEILLGRSTGHILAWVMAAHRTNKQSALKAIWKEPYAGDMNRTIYEWVMDHLPRLTQHELLFWQLFEAELEAMFIPYPYEKRRLHHELLNLRAEAYGVRERIPFSDPKPVTAQMPWQQYLTSLGGINEVRAAFGIETPTEDGVGMARGSRESHVDGHTVLSSSKLTPKFTITSHLAHLPL